MIRLENKTLFKTDNNFIEYFCMQKIYFTFFVYSHFPEILCNQICPLLSSVRGTQAYSPIFFASINAYIYWRIFTKWTIKLFLWQFVNSASTIPRFASAEHVSKNNQNIKLILHQYNTYLRIKWLIIVVLKKIKCFINPKKIFKKEKYNKIR